MTGQVRIRPIKASDEAEWRRLWTLYLEFYESTVPEEVYRTTFDRIISDHAASEAAFYEPRGLLALSDGKPVGLVHYFYHRHCWQVEHVCYLQDLFAVSEVRGAGVGRGADRGGLPRSRRGWMPARLLDDTGVQCDCAQAL